jgi:trehalose 6-phosphate synthase/phosphatase
MIDPVLTEKYRSASRRLVLLDYDGTLVNFATIPEHATPTQNLLDILLRLIDSPHTRVIVITGRAQQEIDKFLGHLPITIIAEHGAMIKDKGEWQCQINPNSSWKNKVLPVLNKMTLSCPHSFIEEKQYSLAWHYRNADINNGIACSRELIISLDNILRSDNLRITDGNKVVEITTLETNKGKAIQFLINPAIYDCILCIGDDRTDEDMFESLLETENAFTVKVGVGDTRAKYRLDNVEQVVLFLQQLE